MKNGHWAREEPPTLSFQLSAYDQVLTKFGKEKWGINNF